MSHFKPAIEFPSEDGPDAADVMSFQIDVVEEDLPARIEDLMRLSALGKFREAREQSLDLFSRDDDVFPVKMECMRLLFEQGDFDGLLNYTSTQFSVTGSSGTWIPRLHEITRHLRSCYDGAASMRSSGEPNYNNDTEHIMITQMHDLATLSREEMDHMTVRRNVAHDYRLEHSDILKCVDSPLLFVIFVLALCKSDITQEVWFPFAPRSDMELVRQLLEARNYWAAENFLKFSIRGLAPRKSPEVEAFRYIGSQIELYLRSHMPKDGEVCLLAKLELLQIFFEGYINQQSADSLRSNLEMLRDLLQRASKFERALLEVIPATDWLTTRIRIRRELLMHDLSSAELTRSPELYDVYWNEDLINSEKTLRTLEELKVSAGANHDLRCVRAIELRQKSAAGQGIQETPPIAFAFFPENLYHRISAEKNERQQLQDLPSDAKLLRTRLSGDSGPSRPPKFGHSMFDPSKYTIGWVCALPAEAAAALAFLDESHEDVDYVAPPNDFNAYSFGRIARNDVVIAVNSHGEYGLTGASEVARDMIRSFPNLRLALMVGIGGGAPRKDVDIRLGDVVVGYHVGHIGYQFDYEKSTSDGKWLSAGHLNKPPNYALSAIGALTAEELIGGWDMGQDIRQVLSEHPRMEKTHARPDDTEDRLFKPTFRHKNVAQSCAQCCLNTDMDEQLILRYERDDDNPVVHYGTIASATTLMQDAVARDTIASQQDILCFEMEAAGLMNLTVDALVIRGICDYADSHKNDKWHGYAALSASAFAKRFLEFLPASDVAI